jgi:hypothetical protein
MGNPNPKKVFLQDLGAFLHEWKNKGKQNEVIIMADMNGYIGEDDLANFCLENALVDVVAMLNPALDKDTTYLWGNKRLDYILASQKMAEVAIKAGHHQFNQNFISDHKGVYVQFKADDLFDTDLMDKSHASYRRLRLGRRDIVERYIIRLEELYTEHKVLERAEKIASTIHGLLKEDRNNEGEIAPLFKKLDTIDKERVGYMISAENFAGKPPPNGVYECSPSLEKAARTTTSWKMRLVSQKTGIDDSERLKRLKKAVPLTTREILIGNRLKAN